MVCGKRDRMKAETVAGVQMHLGAPGHIKQLTTPALPAHCKADVDNDPSQPQQPGSPQAASVPRRPRRSSQRRDGKGSVVDALCLPAAPPVPLDVASQSTGRALERPVVASGPGWLVSSAPPGGTDALTLHSRSPGLRIHPRWCTFPSGRQTLPAEPAWAENPRRQVWAGGTRRAAGPAGLGAAALERQPRVFAHRWMPRGERLDRQLGPARQGHRRAHRGHRFVVRRCPPDTGHRQRWRILPGPQCQVAIATALALLAVSLAVLLKAGGDAGPGLPAVVARRPANVT